MLLIVFFAVLYIMEAEKCGLHRTYISAIECYRRSISLENVQRIADALGIETYNLFWRNEYGAQEIRLDFLTGRLRESFRHTAFFTRLKCNAILIKERDCLLGVNLVEYGRSHPIRGANGIL